MKKFYKIFFKVTDILIALFLFIVGASGLLYIIINQIPFNAEIIKHIILLATLYASIRLLRK